MSWRREMVALGVTDADVTDCENALWTFARTTIYPHAVVVSAGREILRSQVLRGESLRPSDPDAWASRLLARFQSAKFGTYWMDLPGWVQAARRVWSRPGTGLSVPDLAWQDPFAEPPASFRLHPMDRADGVVPSDDAVVDRDADARPVVDAHHIGDAATLTRAMGRQAEGVSRPAHGRR